MKGRMWWEIAGRRRPQPSGSTLGMIWSHLWQACSNARIQAGLLSFCSLEAAEDWNETVRKSSAVPDRSVASTSMLSTSAAVSSSSKVCIFKILCRVAWALFWRSKSSALSGNPSQEGDSESGRVSIQDKNAERWEPSGDWTRKDKG